MQLPKIHLVERERLYFDKFKYRLTFDMWCVGWTEYRRTFKEFDDELTKRLKENKRYPTTWNSAIPYPDCENVDSVAISKFIDYREKYHPKHHKATIAGIYTSGNNARVFANDLQIIHETFDLGGRNFELTEVKVAPTPPGQMFRKRPPKFRYRVYFRDRRVTQEWKDRMLNFLANHPSIHPSPATLEFFKGSVRRFSGTRLCVHHYVEFDHPGGEMILTLAMNSEFLGKHFELIHKQ